MRAGLVQQIKPEGTINYVYDPATGRHTETWTGSSRSSEGTDTFYGYDTQGRLSSTTVTVLNGVTLTSSQITIDIYDAVGDKATELLPNGMLTTYSYNGRNQLTDETVTRSGTSVFAQHYTLADNGRRDAVSETELQADGSTATSSTTWSYDNLDRLTGEAYTNSDSSKSYTDGYTYDLVGNRLTKTHASGSNSESIAYTYNHDDQLQTETATLNGSSEYATTYSYDLNGSLIAKTRTGTSSETDTYTYDLQNRLVGSSVNGTTTYATDAAGDRVSETTGGVTTYSLVDDNNPTGYSQILEQRTSLSGAPTTSYIIGDRVVGQGTAGASSYLVADGQGSTRILTDASGTITERYLYDAFGNALSGTAGTTILYTGQQFDVGLGEYHLRARDYNPLTGTLSSFDSAKKRNSDPLSLHKYLYAKSNPVNGYDPSGHFEIADILASVGILGTLGATVGGIAGGVLFHATGGGVLQGILSGALGGSALGVAVAEGPIEFGKALGIGLTDAVIFSAAEGLAEWALHPNNFAPDKVEIGRQAFAGFATGAASIAYGDYIAEKLGSDDDAGLIAAGTTAIETFFTSLAEPDPNATWLKKFAEAGISAGIDAAITFVIIHRGIDDIDVTAKTKIGKVIEAGLAPTPLASPEKTTRREPVDSAASGRSPRKARP